MDSAQRGQKLREEAAKKEAQRRLAQQELLLQKDLDAVGLSDLYRKLSAGSQVQYSPQVPLTYAGSIS